MALSGPTGVPFTIRAVGIPSAMHLAQNVPEGILPPAIADTLDDLVKLGIDLMTINILNTIRTEKSTGALAASVEGFWNQISGSAEETGGTYEMEIGSTLPYAKYVSREIGLSTINRNVQVQPGKWRFIGIRAPIPKHPFLEQTLADLHKVMPVMLGRHFTRYAGEIQREADALSDQE